MKEKFAPTIVLGVICLIASLLLAAVYQVTAPKIEEITIANANAARAEVMPEATGFADVSEKITVEDVTEIYEAENGTGYVITAACKGFGGDITVMTAITPDGTIEAVKVTDASNETAGLGSRTTEADHAAKFTGAAKLTMNADETDAQYIAPISGVTYSSKGVFNAVNAALQQFAEIGGAQ